MFQEKYFEEQLLSLIDREIKEWGQYEQELNLLLDEGLDNSKVRALIDQVKDQVKRIQSIKMSVVSAIEGVQSISRDEFLERWNNDLVREHTKARAKGDPSAYSDIHVPAKYFTGGYPQVLPDQERSCRV